MSILTTIGQYIPGSENYGHYEKNIAPLLAIGLATAGGFVKAGGIGAIGARKRTKKELQKAQLEQRERQFNYETFDYNQDVGYITNPYREEAKKQQEFLQENIDKSTALNIDITQRSGAFGATQSLLNAQTTARRDANQTISAIRTKGNLYVEEQRQGRIDDRYDQAETFLARADNRLAAAKKARVQAKEKLTKAITAGVVSGAGAAIGGIGAGKAAKGALLEANPDATAAQLKAANRGAFGKGALDGSGLFPSSLTGGGGAGSNLTIEQLEELLRLKKGQ